MPEHIVLIVSVGARFRGCAIATWILGVSVVLKVSLIGGGCLSSNCAGCDADFCGARRSSHPTVMRSDTTSAHRDFDCSGGRFGGFNSEKVGARVMSLRGMTALAPFASPNARMPVVGVLPNFQGFGGSVSLPCLLFSLYAEEVDSPR